MTATVRVSAVPSGPPTKRVSGAASGGATARLSAAPSGGTAARVSSSGLAVAATVRVSGSVTEDSTERVSGTFGILAVGVLDLASSSDLGASSTDDISTDTTPTFTFEVTALAVGDTVVVYDNGNLVASRVLTQGEIDNGLNLALQEMSEGTHPITVRLNNGKGLSPPSNAINYVLDLTPPTAPVLSPLNAATNVAINAPITYTANENIAFQAVVDIGIFKSDDTPVRQYTEDDIDAGISISGKVLTISVPNLSGGTAHYVQVSGIRDIAGNVASAIADKTSWTFTTVSTGATAGQAVGLLLALTKAA